MTTMPKVPAAPKNGAAPKIAATLKGLAVGVLSAVLVLIGFVPPAQAAAELELSLDGVHWVQELPEPLFAAGDKLTPGESRSAQLWVRNSASMMAQLSARLTDAAWQGLIADGVARVSATTARSSTDLVRENKLICDLAAGKSEEITITVTLSSVAGNSAEGVGIPISFALSLRQSVPGTADPTSTPTSTPTNPTPGNPSAGGTTPGAVPDPNKLPETGFPAGAVLTGLLSAVVLIALGLGILGTVTNKGRHGGSA